MITRRERLFGGLVLACDMIGLAGSLAIALGVRMVVTGEVPRSFPSEYLWHSWILLFALPVWGFLLHEWRLDTSRTYRSAGGIFARLFQVQIIGGLTLMSAMYLTKSSESRITSQAFLGASFLVLLFGNLFIRALLIRRRRNQKSSNRWRVLVIGSDEDAQRYVKILREYPYWAVDVVAFIAWPDSIAQVRGTGTHGTSIITTQPASQLTVSDWHQILHSYVVDEVVTVIPWERSADTQSLAIACRQKGLTFRLLVQMPPAPVGEYHVEDLGSGTYTLSLETIPQLTPALLIKRMIDIASASVGLLVFAAIYGWYSWILKRESPGPVLFHQERIGQNGRSFTLYKFRTMCLDADQKLPQLMQYNEMNGLMFKMQNDPRVTPTGKWMRRTHLDELPQFWNVLRGDMSLVGTRPPTPSEVAHYQPHHHRRLSMKPGLTGLWQLNGNGKVRDFEEVVKLDCEYIDQWSLAIDLRIVAKTVVKVVRAAGW